MEMYEWNYVMNIWNDGKRAKRERSYMMMPDLILARFICM